MMRIEEQLSRLLSGDLDADEARALRQRIGEDRELAELWALMQGLPDELGDLPVASPPPHLDAAVKELARPAPVSRPWGRIGAVVLAVAAATLLFLRPTPTPTPELVLTQGVHHVEGHALLMVGDTTIEVDGVAEIFVEPVRSPPRVGEAEVEMNRNHMIAAGLGAGVTILVHQGFALISDGNAAPLQVDAGGSHQVEAAAGAPVTRSAERTVLPPGTSTADAQARIDELEDMVAQLSFENAVYRGRLEGMEGTPQAWPEDLAASYRPEGYEAVMQELVDGFEGAELFHVDCDEYPCIAIIQGQADDAWTEAWEAYGSANITKMFGDTPPQTSASYASHSTHDDREAVLYGIVLLPENKDAVPGLSERIEYRADAQMGDATEQLLYGGE